MLRRPAEQPLADGPGVGPVDRLLRAGRQLSHRRRCRAAVPITYVDSSTAGNQRSQSAAPEPIDQAAGIGKVTGGDTPPAEGAVDEGRRVRAALRPRGDVRHLGDVLRVVAKGHLAEGPGTLGLAKGPIEAVASAVRTATGRHTGCRGLHCRVDLSTQLHEPVEASAGLQATAAQVPSILNFRAGGALLQHHWVGKLGAGVPSDSSSGALGTSASVAASAASTRQ